MYKLVMSNEMSRKWGSIGVSFNLCNGSLEFSVLKALGKGARWPTFCVNSLASLYTGVLRQLTMGRIGWSGLCSFIKPLMVGANGFMLMYFPTLTQRPSKHTTLVIVKLTRSQHRGATFTN